MSDVSKNIICRKKYNKNRKNKNKVKSSKYIKKYLNESNSTNYSSYLALLLAEFNSKNINHFYNGVNLPMYAYINNHFFIFKNLLQFDELSINNLYNHYDGKKYTLLMFAVMNMKTAYVEEILKHKNIDINSSNHDINTAHNALLLSKNPKITDILLSHPNIDINSVNDRGDNNFKMAVKMNNHFLFNRLLKNKKCNYLAKNHDGNNAIFTAVHCNHIDMFDSLIQMENFDVNSQNDKGNTILHVAVSQNNYILLKKILAIPNIDINIKNKNNLTALEMSCYYKKIHSIINLLLTQKNIDCNFRDGSNILHYLIKNKLDKNLVNHALTLVDVNREDNCGYTPLLLAILHKKKAFINILLNLENIDLEKSLLFACKKNDNNTIKKILKKNININTIDENSDNILIIACKNNNHKIIKQLLEYPGIDINYKNNNDMSAYDYCTDSELCSLFIERGYRNLFKSILFSSFSKAINNNYHYTPFNYDEYKSFLDNYF